MKGDIHGEVSGQTVVLNGISTSGSPSQQSRTKWTAQRTRQDLGGQSLKVDGEENTSNRLW